MPLLLLLACRVPAPDVVGTLETLTRGAPTHDQVAATLDVRLKQARATEYTVEYRGSTSSFSEIGVFEARGEGTAAPRVALTVARGCVRFEQMKERFGFAHASQVHPGAPEPDGEQYVHQLSTGRMTVTYREDCLREVVFAGE